MRVVLPPVPNSAAAARSAAREALVAWRLGALEETVALLVTELISNGVRHAGTSLELLLDYEQTCLRVSVSDAAPTVSVKRGGRTRGEFGGWGLDLVDALSARWNVDVDGSGTKSVWFEIDTPPVAPGKGGPGESETGTLARDRAPAATEGPAPSS